MREPNCSLPYDGEMMDNDLKVLFIDDSEGDVLLLVRELKKNEFNVEWKRVENREDLLHALESKEWNLIVIDYVIPGFSGEEALKICVKMTSFIPIISTSGVVQDETIVETLRNGSYDYVLKSNLHRFVSSVRRAIEDAETRERNAWHEAENKRLNRELALKYEIADICLTVSDKGMYQKVLDVVLREFESPCGIFGYVNDQNKLVCPAVMIDAEGQYQEPDKEEVVFPENLWREIADNARKNSETTFENMSFPFPGICVPIKNLLSTQIRYNNRIIGVIMVANKHGSYSKADAQLLETVANQISPVLNSRLETSRELFLRRKAEEERDNLFKETLQKAEETSQLLAGAKAVLEDDDFTVTARRLFNASCQATRATSGYVALLSSGGQENEVLFLEAGGLSCSVNPDLPMPIRGLRGEAYKLGKAVFHNDFHNSEWAEFLPEGHVRLKNVLFSPLNIGDKTVGIMGLANKPTDFTEEDLRIAEGFGELAAIALKNSRTYEAMQNSEELHRLLADNTIDVIWKMDLSGTFTYVNPAIENLMGYTPEEWIGTNLRDHTDKPNMKIMQGAMRKKQFMHPNGPGITFQAELLDKNRRPVPIETSGKILVNGEGKPTGYQGVTRDITERKKVEKQLIEYHEQLEKKVEDRTADLRMALFETEQARDRIDTILKSVADGLIVTDKHNHVILMNRAAEDILNIRLSEVVNRSIELSIKDATLREKIMYTLGKQLTGYEFDFTVADPDRSGQRTIRARTSVVPDRQEGISGIVTILQDVTREREIDRMKTEFISTAAHELRTPLTSIQGFSEILLIRDNIDEENRKKYLEYINKQSVGLANIISDLLDISRIESGIGFALQKKLCDGKQIIEAILPHFKELSKKHVFIKELYDKPIKLHVDHEKMEQVLTNLLSNSIKYSPKGGTIKIRTGVEESKNKKKATRFFISVQDEGMGMTQAQVERIFDKFYRADASNTAIEGTGLGMSIVKHIVDAHEGSIDISSQKGKGTTVTILLPLNGD